jgi:trans-aconitate 2-methyltransferase
LFANLAQVLRPGGELQAQCGGAGNIANVTRAAAELGIDLERDKHFADPASTERRLRDAGFTEVRCWLTDAPTPLPNDQLERYLATVCMGAVVDGMAAAERDRVLHAVADRMDEPRIDYVRLNMAARRSS